jgi:heme/copper-type cytochrome/quinol oxidase subunit 2
MKRVIKQVSVASVVAFVFSLCASASTAFAQCAMCKAAAAASGNSAAETLNMAILVLLIPPVVIFCAIFVVAYRLREAQADTQPRERQKEERAKHRWIENPDAR